MATSDATLTSLWVDDGSGQARSVSGTPVKIVSSAGTSGMAIRNDMLQFYKDNGLDGVAREAGILDANGGIATIKTENEQPIVSTGCTQQQQQQPKAVQMIALPIAASPAKPALQPAQIFPKTATVPTSFNAQPVQLINTATTGQAIITGNQIVTPKGTQFIKSYTVPVESPHFFGPGRKRTSSEFAMHDLTSDGKRRKGEKGGKGLRHFSMKVCEKVQSKGITSYNEVADELVAEFTDPRTMMPAESYDQKNIRRRVYDALNVLMAMNIISKEKKEIKWIGLPTNSAQECQTLQREKQLRSQRIQQKTQQLQELILQQIAFKNLVQRNRQLEQNQGSPGSNSAIQLPFIIVNTSKKTVIDCSISNDKYEYLFNFDNTFEIHDDIEVLKRMGMAYGLEKGQCSDQDLEKATRLVPQALESYVRDLAHSSKNSTSVLPATVTIKSEPEDDTLTDLYRSGPSTGMSSPLALPLAGTSSAMDMSMDAEVSALSQGLSRQSSFSDHLARDTPDDPYSDGSDSEQSSTS